MGSGGSASLAAFSGSGGSASLAAYRQAGVLFYAALPGGTDGYGSASVRLRRYGWVRIRLRKTPAVRMGTEKTISDFIVIPPYISVHIRTYPYFFHFFRFF